MTSEQKKRHFYSDIKNVPNYKSADTPSSMAKFLNNWTDIRHVGLKRTRRMPNKPKWYIQCTKMVEQVRFPIALGVYGCAVVPWHFDLAFKE